ncbi:MAG TPA: hypothetical protein VN635_09070 [Conexibacter sp.]|nr:hypothetical protein [Conexibacter sp.]
MAQTTTSPKPRRTAAKRAPRSGAAKTRSTAPKTAARAASSSTRPQTRAARAQQLAERAVLIPVGAALEARDRVAGTLGDIVTTTRSRGELQRQLTRFERRGDAARTQLEREVRRTRSQLERRTRTARRGFEPQRTQARKNLDMNAEGFVTRVEKVVQNGLDAGMKLVNGAQDRLPKVF